MCSKGWPIETTPHGACIRCGATSHEACRGVYKLGSPEHAAHLVREAGPDLLAALESIEIQECGFCRGSGEVIQHSYATGEGESISCPVCMGSGETAINVSVPTIRAAIRKARGEG